MTTEPAPSSSTSSIPDPIGDSILDPIPSPPALAAIVGCGVIGAAWACRMSLSGTDVRVSDPSPRAGDLLDEVLENAVAAWAELGLPTGRRGTITLCSSVTEAVSDVEFVQESVPERPDIKAAVLSAIEEAAPPEALIASSTSGIRPTELQKSMIRPARFVVGHPFNPVYLLPLVEVVGGVETSPETIERAKSVYTGFGMKPLHVRVEIDAFIADRLLEAVWREALWLVNDGVATTAEIDDAITYGFGLRWAQMGLFETYRVAGGAGGFRHFIEQFGPALDWPWTRLIDTPEFTPELIDTIVDQSDEQSGMHELRDLERIRDRNIVGFLRVLEENRWGAGTTVAAQRNQVSRLR
ncbi:MAG: 3-hydroxyacyl-CoA dehydrogenase NAD-binding domain-containing protein [Acidimicrobiales bacterium]